MTKATAFGQADDASVRNRPDLVGLLREQVGRQESLFDQMVGTNGDRVRCSGTLSEGAAGIDDQPTRALSNPAQANPPLSTAPRLVLSDLEKRAVSALVSDDPAALLEHVRGLAEALAGLEAEATRRRTIARLLATSRAELQVLDVLLAETLRKRNFDGAAALTKACARLDRRVLGLLDQHRAETSPRRPGLTVRAEVANVLAVEKGS